MMTTSPSAAVIEHLKRFSRDRRGRALLSWLLGHMSFVIPAEHLCETDTLLAFRHPQPAYPFHVLLLPRRPLASLTDLSARDQPFLADLFAAVQELVQRFDLEPAGYRLVVNGGKNQDFGLLHFHLISDKRTE